MRHLFSPAGERALQQLMTQRWALLAFDFDGTLAPIVTHPDDARVSTAIARHLAALARQRPVAVVTGRSVDDVRPRLGFTPAYLVGNHGAEGLDWRGNGQHLAALREHLQRHGTELRAAGVSVEDKGQSLALHYRLARHRATALHLIDALLSDLAPDLSRFGGKCVVNIVVRDAPDKGEAVLALLRESGCDAVLFVGDDVTDEAVFARAAPHWLTVQIGHAPRVSNAMFCLAAHTEMATLLAKMQSALATPD